MTGFFICDLIDWNIIVALRNQFDGIAWPGAPSIFRFLTFTAYAIPYSFIKGFTWLRIQKIAAEKEKISASLYSLRSQIDPHFIFNSLNSVYALSLEEKATKTSASIEELSSIFRYSLKESNVDKVSIKEELDFIEKYIHLHRIRIGGRRKS